ncbi:MAG TPA: hypothetical protein VMU89_02070 [Thermomicrobiaceae bacterium]|nr:hypothetical protein [Thermomicrobiaceae bacterium]
MEPSRVVDLLLVVVANGVNLLLAGMFLARAARAAGLERVLGLSTVALSLPLTVATLLNLAGGRPWWSVLLPLLLVAYLSVELVLDYILRLDFRHTRLLWPYLLLFYLAVNAMTGYAFLVGRTFGFVTLGSYFLCLAATWYSYAHVGHG